MPDAIVLLRNDHKVTVLIESVRHHVEEEETEMFPQVREALGRCPRPLIRRAGG
jgi:hypothetical protein